MTADKILSCCPDALTYGRARYLFTHGRVRRVAASPDLMVGIVEDGAPYHVRVSARPDGLSSFCTCSGGRMRRFLCSHAAALCMDSTGSAAQPGETSAEDLLDQFEPLPAREPVLSLRACLSLEDVPCLSLKIGVKRLYVVPDLAALMRAYRSGDSLRLGKGLTCDFSLQDFTPASEPLAEMVERGLEYLETYGMAEKRVKSLPLTDGMLTEALAELHDTPFELTVADATQEIRRIREGRPPLAFRLRDEDAALRLEVEGAAACRALDRSARYVLCHGAVYALDEEARAALSPFLALRGQSSYSFRGKQRERLLSEVLPRLRAAADVQVDAALRQRMVREPLAARATLDTAAGEITCQVAFAYGATTIDPFSPAPAQEDDLLLERDAPLERAILDVLSRHGFRVRSGGAYLSGDENIYAFLTEGVSALQSLCEVYSSKDLLALRPRRVSPRGRLSMSGGALEFRLMLEGVEPMDHAAVLEALRDRREFVRLGDGAFLALGREEGWGQLAEYLGEAAEQEGDVLRLANYRAAYLDTLLENSHLMVERDEAVRGIAHSLSHPGDDQPPLPGLRPYQRRGFAWLKSLAQLNMGGILADDMGLGKTLQILALTEWGRLSAQERLPTLIVAPTTLTYNWLEEARKFAPHLRVAVLEGSAEERRAQAVAAAAECDMVIMSYAQVRRDAEVMREIPFRFVVLDEAQNIKNAASVGAESVKQLQANAKFALTGTPMENHPGELWSLFDFVLPGYLGAQEDFMRRFGSIEDAQDLAMRIRPFLMRRVKRDVLRELPEKIEHRISAELTPGQREVYNATLSKTRQELDEMLAEKGGLEKSRFKILAAITRLRQICCHPSLYLSGYEGGSGKMELLLELLRDALAADHRILLFSQFTSMLQLIAQELERQGVEYFYLDGKVPSRERLDMANRFNEKERPVFLISLRAGGTGLNLTAADTVIHYDPWWNPAVEDQATDRAHRIGQEKVVEVIKLVARDTIEEKVFTLKGQKQEWIDRIVTPGEFTPGKMTAAEILSIFQ